jgi:iron(III) transport system permease protein
MAGWHKQLFRNLAGYFDPTTWVGICLLAIVAILALYPLSLIIVNSFQISRPGAIPAYGLEGWRAVFQPAIWQSLYNTFMLVLARQLISFPLAILLAWLIARTDLPGRDFFEFAFWIPFFLPALPVTLGWILVLDPNFGLLNAALMKLPFIERAPFNIYSFWGIVWVHFSLYTLSIKIMLLTPAFRNMDSTLEEASRTCGGNPLGTLRRIVAPLMMPTLLAVFTLGTIRSLEAFEVEIMLGLPIGLHVYSTMIYDLVRWEPPRYAPAMALATLFLVLLVSMVMMQIAYIGRRQFRTIGGQGHRSSLTALGPWKWIAFTLVFCLAFAFTVIPLVFLLLASFMRMFGFFNLEDAWTLLHWKKVLADPIFLRSVVNTVILALGSIAGIVVLSLGVAYVVAKSGFRGGKFLDFLAWLPWGIPGILLGLAFLWVFLGNAILAPLYGTMVVLILAMIVKDLPMGSQLFKGVMLNIGRELEEASLVSGARWFSTFRRILLPIMLPTVLAVALVSMITTMRDTSTMVLLANAQTRPLALLMLDYLVESKEYERAAVVGAIITLWVLATALVVRRFGLRLSFHA